jgi:8-oxo-dGTP diphosphatase
MLSGMTEYVEVTTNEVHRFVKGDLFVIYPGTAYLQRVKRDTRILFFKLPAGNDKVLVDVPQALSDWANGPLRARRVDSTAADGAPAANSLKPAVAVAAVNPSGELLLVRRRDSGYWALPGGTLELSESIEDCARREVREETGVQLGELRIVGTYTGRPLHHHGRCS